MFRGNTSRPILAALATMLVAGLSVWFVQERIEYLPMSFGFENASETEIVSEILRFGKGFKYRLVAVGKDFAPFPLIRKNREQRGDEPSGGTTLDRYGFSASDFSNEPATLFWWNWTDLRNKPKPYSRNKYPEALKRQLLKFPEFNDDLKVWRCHYAFQPGGFWVGRFNGIELKPAGQRISNPDEDKVDKNAETKQKPSHLLAGKLVEVEEHWIQFEVKNNSGKKVIFRGDGLTLLHQDKNSKVRLGLPYYNEEELEHSGRDGCVAHSPKGSMYRPEIGSQVRINWLIDEQKFEQLIDLPEFDPAQTHWYCYFTLDSSNTWTATFEGTKSK